MFGVELQFKAYLVVKPRNPRNHAPKFQTKFGVAKEEPTAQGNGLPRDSANADTTTAIDESKEMTMKIKRNLA